MGKIVIVDYTLGNLFNVQRALQHVGAEAIISDKVSDLQEAEKIILPGVGAFNAGIKQLEEKGLLKALQQAAKAGRHILGICLGMQLLMRESEEHGQWRGLELIPGQVVYFDRPTAEKKFKIPQIGWNQLEISNTQNSILNGIKTGAQMYFVHSLYVKVDDSQNAIAYTNYGFNRFCSVIQKDNVMGCQFHPERSAEDGLKIMKNFIDLR